jgi:CheY-like chemotaxis protein
VSSQGSPVILVVDDESDVLRLVESILSGENYTVLTARNAEDALQIFKSLPEPPDLILSDVVMPGTSGPMMTDQMRLVTPDLRILFMSGYDDRHVVQRYVVDQGFGLLAKPFTASALRTFVHDGLKKPRVTPAESPN